MMFAGCASGGSQRPTNDDLWGKSRSRQARSLSKSAAAESTPIYKPVSAAWGKSQQFERPVWQKRLLSALSSSSTFLASLLFTFHSLSPLFEVHEGVIFNFLDSFNSTKPFHSDSCIKVNDQSLSSDQIGFLVLGKPSFKKYRNFMK